MAGAASPGVGAHRLDGFSLAQQPAGRPVSSASIALRWAKMGTRAAESGRARAREALRSRLARSSSAVVSPLTSWPRLGSGTGDPRIVFLLGKVGTGDATAGSCLLGAVQLGTFAGRPARRPVPPRGRGCSPLTGRSA